MVCVECENVTPLSAEAKDALLDGIGSAMSDVDLAQNGIPDALADALPTIFESRYNAKFLAKYLEVLEGVEDSLFEPNYRPKNTVEEIAFRHIVLWAVEHAPNIARELDDFHSMHVEDMDIEFLFGGNLRAVDGTLDGAMGTVNLNFDSWFKRFRTEQD